MIGAAYTAPEQDPIEARWSAVKAAHPELMREFLRIALAKRSAGATWWSAKDVWEDLRRSIVTDAKPYRLNNDFTALAARDAMAADRRLEGFFRIRRRKGEPETGERP